MAGYGYGGPAGMPGGLGAQGGQEQQLQASLVQNLAQFQNTAQTNMLQQAATQTQAYNAALAQQQAQAENLFTGL